MSAMRFVIKTDYLADKIKISLDGKPVGELSFPENWSWRVEEQLQELLHNVIDRMDLNAIVERIG